MKTSVVEVRAMLSVWSVDEVERRIGEVPGVESVTVNHADGSATVRYDETRLEIADIKRPCANAGMSPLRPLPLRRATFTKATRHRARRLQPPHRLRRKSYRSHLPPRAPLPQARRDKRKRCQPRLRQHRGLPHRNLPRAPCPRRPRLRRPYPLRRRPTADAAAAAPAPTPAAPAAERPRGPRERGRAGRHAGGYGA